MNVWAAERFGTNISIVPDDVAHTGILLNEVWIKEITKSMDWVPIFQCKIGIQSVIMCKSLHQEILTGRCRHNAKIITFFLGVQRCDTIVFTHLVYVTKLFTARSELFTNCFCCCTALFCLFCCLSRRKRIAFCFECCYDSAKPSVEGQYHILRSYFSNKSAKRDRYVLRFRMIYHMPHCYRFINIQISMEKIVKIAKIITKFLNGQRNRPMQ